MAKYHRLKCMALNKNVFQYKTNDTMTNCMSWPTSLWLNVIQMHGWLRMAKYHTSCMKTDVSYVPNIIQMHRHEITVMAKWSLQMQWLTNVWLNVIQMHVADYVWPNIIQMHGWLRMAKCHTNAWLTTYGQMSYKCMADYVWPNVIQMHGWQMSYKCMAAWASWL